MATLTTRELNRATLARQLLLERHDLGVVDAVGRLAGMQAQEPKHPYAGLWTRLTGFTDETLTAAVRDRSVVRATMMRGTLHLVGADDYAAWRSTLAPVLEGGLALLGDRAAGLDPDAVATAAREVLADGPLTFTAIRAALVERFPAVNDRALGFCTRMLVPLVVVPADDARWGFGANAPFTPAESWLGVAPRPDAVPAELVRRYLAAFGPASAADFQTWSGLKASPEDLADSLEVFTGDDGTTLYDVPDAPRPDPDTPAPVRFLPEFDNLLLAHRRRTRLIDDEHRPAVVTKNLRVRSTYLVDGRVAGVWTVARTRGTATLTLAPFGRLTKPVRRELEREADGLLRFLEPAAKGFAVAVADR